MTDYPDFLRFVQRVSTMAYWLSQTRPGEYLSDQRVRNLAIIFGVTEDQWGLCLRLRVRHQVALQKQTSEPVHEFDPRVVDYAQHELFEVYDTRDLEQRRKTDAGA